MSNRTLELIAKEKIAKTGRLDLGNCGLTELPKELFELTWLEELNVCNEYWDDKEKRRIKSQNKGGENNLFIIPNPIQKLQALKILRLNGEWGESMEYSRYCTFRTTNQFNLVRP